jgi:hypothetical protein
MSAGTKDGMQSRLIGSTDVEHVGTFNSPVVAASARKFERKSSRGARRLSSSVFSTYSLNCRAAASDVGI